MNIHVHSKMNVYVSHYTREDDGFYIPSLAYDGHDSERHFSADDSGYAFPDDLFDGTEVSIQRWNDKENTYETFDFVNEALANTITEGGTNSHTVVGIANFNAADEVIAITLFIYWPK